MKDHLKLFDIYSISKFTKLYKCLYIVCMRTNAFFINDAKIYFLQEGNIFFQKPKIMLSF